MTEHTVEIWTRDSGSEPRHTVTTDDEDVVSALEELPFTTPHVTRTRVTRNR